MPGKIAPREHTKAIIDASIRKAIRRTTGKPRKKFIAMLAEIQHRSDLLRPARLRGPIDPDDLNNVLTGLRHFSDQRRDWLRPLESWRPDGSSLIAMFSSLAHHLMAHFPVPPILLSAWFTTEEWQARYRQGWFKGAGKGTSLRAIGLPLTLTRRMAHEFAQAPTRFAIEFALRWSQVRSLGGSDGLARAIASTRLGVFFQHHEFWTSVIHFFINHPELDPAHVGPVVEYLQAQRFEPRRAIIGENTEVFFDPPQPELCLKGWSVASLLRRVEEWKAQCVAEQDRSLFRWERSDIGEFLEQDEQGRAWSIRELLDSDELAAEGQSMNHCVANYTADCTKRTSTIWSVGIEGEQGRERVATVEVNPVNRTVVQAKAKENEVPDESCQKLLNHWASQQALILLEEAYA